tara:strand:+ start:302 stop:586 length:285 start_codon:yes stop_codon:yes gene_type:complete
MSDFNDGHKNPAAEAPVDIDSPMKEWLVSYVGEKHEPNDGNVTVEMIVETMATEFPDFLLVVAEENWIRGYHQALTDVEVGRKIQQEAAQTSND